jgi:endonuclease I
VLGALLILTTLPACGRGAFMAPLRPAGDATAFAAQAADAYYKSVTTLKGQALVKGLNKLVSTGAKSFSYDQARDKMFGSIDDPTNKNVIVDVYCGRTGKGVTDRKTAFHRGLNAEHTWPQSMGAQEEPAKSDLHHLFPADAGTNSQRNNNAYGVPAKVRETLPNYLDDGMNSKVGTAADGVTVFEPRDDHKGDVARALFYFYVRYASGQKATPGVKLDNFRREFVTLWRWHFQDPPSAKEKARNEAIWRLQHNRNPFIDHPEFVQKIGHFLAVRDGSDILANNGSREDLDLPAFETGY